MKADPTKMRGKALPGEHGDENSIVDAWMPQEGCV